MSKYNADLTDPDERREAAETLQAIKAQGRLKNATSFLNACKYIVEHGAIRWHGRLVDRYSASAFLTVHKALEPDNQAKLEQLAEQNPVKAVSVCFKLCK